MAGNAVRLDTSLALPNAPADGGPGGTTLVSMLLASYRVAPNFAPFVRLGYLNYAPESPAVGSSLFIDPVVGANYGFSFGDFRGTAMLAFALPIGQGGGDDQTADQRAALGAGIFTRSAMDNAMFAVNDFVIFPGVNLAYTVGGFTAQLEATLLKLLRTRGTGDASRTNFTSGLHLGYYIVPQLIISGELRHQRWLSNQTSVRTNPATRENTTAALGLRGVLKITDTLVFRPGISYSRGLDKPMRTAGYQMVQLDLPLSF